MATDTAPVRASPAETYYQILEMDKPGVWRFVTFRNGKIWGIFEGTKMSVMKEMLDTVMPGYVPRKKYIPKKST